MTAFHDGVGRTGPSRANRKSPPRLAIRSSRTLICSFASASSKPEPPAPLRGHGDDVVGDGFGVLGERPPRRSRHSGSRNRASRWAPEPPAMKRPARGCRRIAGSDGSAACHWFRDARRSSSAVLRYRCFPWRPVLPGRMCRVRLGVGHHLVQIGGQDDAGARDRMRPRSACRNPHAANPLAPAFNCAFNCFRMRDVVGEHHLMRTDQRISRVAVVGRRARPRPAIAHRAR